MATRNTGGRASAVIKFGAGPILQLIKKSPCPETCSHRTKFLGLNGVDGQSVRRPNSYGFGQLRQFLQVLLEFRTINLDLGLLERDRNRVLN